MIPLRSMDVGRTGMVWAAHALALAPPLATFYFLTTAPHGPPAIFSALAVVFLLGLFDRAGNARHPSAAFARATPFDALLYVSVVLHGLNVVFLGRLAVRGDVVWWDLLVAMMLVGAGSAYSAVIVAHELIHRRGAVRRLLGRALLWTALYDHFFVEHLRGHHVRVATAEDPTTARFDEPFWCYLVRAVPGELGSAWRLDRRSVTGGLLATGLLAGAALTLGGVESLALLFGQALLAQLLIGTVNYLEHWGLRRSDSRAQAHDSWDCDSFVSHFALFALTRHAGHHARASRPYFELELADESPKLPAGYLRMVALVLLRNATARRLLAEELRRKRLGPFAVNH
jgi:alkane 1-monooxygenase